MLPGPGPNVDGLARTPAIQAATLVVLEPEKLKQVLARGAEHGYGARVYAVEPHEPFVGPRGGQFGPEDRAAFFRNMVRTGA